MIQKTLLLALFVVLSPLVGFAQEEKLKEITVESFAMPSRSGAGKFEVPQAINELEYMEDVGPAREGDNWGTDRKAKYKNTAKMRTASSIKIMNYTKFMVYVYVNDKYVGVIPKYGDTSVKVWDGEIKLFGTAHMSDGTKKEFGPKLQELEKNYFTWILREPPTPEEEN